MKLIEIDKYFKSIMNIEEMNGKDPSMNGIQVSAKDADKNNIEINKIAFAVDACLESFKRAAEQNADMLFVHHGLFWGKQIRVDGIHFRRLKYLFENNIVLYASHLPLDMHPDFGNNAGICNALGLKNIKPFGNFKGIKIGFSGEFEKSIKINDILEKLLINEKEGLAVLPFGPELIKSAAIISGGGPNEVYEAIEEEVDLYITGDASHSIYHSCQENKINMISAGHYNTETWGVNLLSEKVKADLNIETVFIDLPTGL